MLVFFTPERHWQIATNTDRRSAGIAPAGALEIVPAGSDVFAEWSSEKHSLRLDIDDARLKRLANTEFGKDAFELYPPRLGFVDEKAHSLARLMRCEVQCPSFGSDETLDALTTVFAAHLLRSYSSLGKRHSRRATGGLSPSAWRRVDEFIRANLSASLPLEQLASNAGLSPIHFLRAFKHMSGQSPHQYVLTCRLSHARNLITTTDIPFSQIATIVGFSSNSHMTAAMKKAWNTTPSEFRQSAARVGW